MGFDGEGNLILACIACSDTTASRLGSLAEAMAALLVEGDFSLVKQREHPECILWFFDRTQGLLNHHLWKECNRDDPRLRVRRLRLVRAQAVVRELGFKFGETLGGKV